MAVHLAAANNLFDFGEFWGAEELSIESIDRTLAFVMEQLKAIHDDVAADRSDLDRHMAMIEAAAALLTTVKPRLDTLHDRARTRARQSVRAPEVCEEQHCTPAPRAPAQRPGWLRSIFGRRAA